MQDVPKIVVKRMAGAQGMKPHPDADLLTAFCEHSLPPLERKQLVQHLEMCSECRDVLALALPEAEVLPPAAPARSGWRWLSRPALRFSLVTAAVLAIASVGFLQYRQRELSNEGVVAKLDQRDSAQPINKDAATQAAAATRSLSETTLPSEPLAAKPEPRAGRRTLPASNLGGNSFASRSAGGISSGSVAGRALAVPKPAPSPQESLDSAAVSALIKHNRALPSANEKPIAVEAFPGAIEVTAQNQPRDQLVQKEGANNSLNNADIVKAKAAPPAQAAGSASPAFGSPNMTSLQTAPSLMSYASPLWTINSAGGLQRSFDAGKTWEEVNPSEPGLPVGEAAKKAVGNGQEKNLKQGATKLTFRAVAAIGPEVWAGGSGATLYHSADSGSRWQQVLFSADASPTGDIMTIHFSDPQHGTLATSTSEVWTTANNGQTWQKQQ
jgi:hypothetical protein